MEIWQLWGVLGIFFIIIEMTTPVLFFLNLAFSAVIVGIIAYYVNISLTLQITIFAVMSIMFLVFLRPFLMKIKEEPDKTGVKAAYYGQQATVTERITDKTGRIAVFGEAWDARSEDNQSIEEGAIVQIVNSQGLVMIVKKI